MGSAGFSGIHIWGIDTDEEQNHHVAPLGGYEAGYRLRTIAVHEIAILVQEIKEVIHETLF